MGHGSTGSPTAHNDFGVVDGGDGGRIPRPSATPLKGGHAGWENRIGGKAPAAKSRGSFSRTTNTAPKNYDCDENDCAPSRQGARPARQVPRTVTIRSGGGRAFCGGDPEEEGTSMAIAGRGGNDEGAKQDAL